MRTSRLVWAAIAAISFTVAPFALHAQTDLFPTQAPKWSGWRAYWENDSFAFGEGTDRHYTNGLRFTLTEHPERTSALARGMRELCWVALCWAKPATDSSSVVGTWVFGQNMFTPHLITTFEPDSADRPFAGYLYGGYQTTFSGRTELGTSGPRLTIIPENTTEVSVGVLGPLSLAGGAQAGVHVLRENRIPKGWFAQIPMEPTVQLHHLFRIGLRGQLGTSRWLPQAELTPHLSGALGTVQTFGAWGWTGRVGWNLTGLAKDVITFTRDPREPAPNWEIAAVYTWERRATARDAFLDGGLIGDTPSLPRRSTLTDKRIGFELRADPLTVSYRRIDRTQEMEPVPGRDAFPDHRYGSWSLAYTIGTESAVGNAVVWLLEHALIEAGFGTGLTELDGRSVGGRAARLAFGPSFGRFGVSLDLNGVVREARGPAPDGTHTDHFFNNFGGTAWFAAGGLGPGTVLLRAGAGRSLHRHQVVSGEVQEDTDETATRLMLGVGYELPIPFSNEVALGFDVMGGRVPLGGEFQGTDGTFLATVIGIKWRPAFE